MSEISDHLEEQSLELYLLTKGFIDKIEGDILVKTYHSIISSATPKVIIHAFDRIMKEDHDLAEVKKAINKVMNLLAKAIDKLPLNKPKKGSYLHGLFVNNVIMSEKLNDIRPLIKSFNALPKEERIKEKLITAFTDLSDFRRQYIIKENVLFPIIERYLSEHRCLQIMWSFHEDINHNIKAVTDELKKPNCNVKVVNNLLGLIYFNMLAVKFREERILYPIITQTISEKQLNALIPESIELGYAYYTPEDNIKTIEIEEEPQEGYIDMGTGLMSIEQLILLFNHLPIDITFVDENDEVRFFSNTPDRVFPRSKAIIGRLVQNCHPRESIDTVNQIVTSFRKGEKSRADFWINMGDKTIMIQYFAVRDLDKTYRGTIEVTQEISGLKKIEGEKKLLDW